MTTNTVDRAVVGFLWDYNNNELGEPRIYQIIDGDVKTSKPVGVSNGKSTKFFLVETVDRLEVVREAAAEGWTSAQRFWELKKCLRGDALESYKKLVQNNHLDPADKKNTNFEELVHLIPTDSGDYPYPGNKVRHYMMNKVHYMSYRHPGGRRYKPTDVLYWMCQLHKYGSRLQRLIPGGNIVTDAKSLQLVWDIFPKEVHNWLTNNQKIDPFDPNNPLDQDKFCDDLHRYWSMKFKDEKLTKDENKNKGDNTNQQNSQKKPRYNNSGGHTGNNASQAGRGGPQDRQ